VKKRIEAMSISNDLRLEYWPLDRLIPSARNARTHSPCRFRKLSPFDSRSAANQNMIAT
jgi:hypothetical protein